MIKGTIVKILTQMDNDWGRYKIDCFDGKDILAVGVIPNASIGMTVVLEGSEEVNKYGRQYKITDVLSAEADKFSGIRQFLSGGFMKGIGLKTANMMIMTFGEDTLKQFESENGLKSLEKVKGLGKKSVAKAYESYLENKKYKDIVLFLNGSGTRNQVETIYGKYGEQSLIVLKKNPYRLQMDLNGFGFLRADALALASGIKPDSIYRIMAAIKYLIEEGQTNGGHCYLTMEEINDKIGPTLAPVPKMNDITEKVAENALENWNIETKEKLIKAHNPSAESLAKIEQTAESRRIIRDGVADALTEAIASNDFVNYDGKIYTSKMFKTEDESAKIIAEMCHENPVRYIDAKKVESAIKDVEKRKTKALNDNGIRDTFNVTEEQRKAVYLGLMHRISIISGGPGRGKTAISEIIAHGFLSSGRHYDKKDIIMLAPTGRAAQRITESTGYDAMTAHRAIMKMKSSGETPSGKLILCDESSMVDIFLLYNILKFARDCNLIFVGDVDQIASVGPGKVLKDMIESEVVPCILLKQGHRNSGTIAHNSELINNGVKIDKYCYDEHFVYTPCTSDNILDLMVEDYKKKVAQYGIKDVMLCTAMRERGAVCVSKLNKVLQNVYTYGREEAKYSDNRIFRVGDRVMQTKNDYNFVKIVNKEQVCGVFNGERGTVAKIIKDEENDSYKMIVLFDDGSIGGYNKSTAVNLTLAYATTLHKCQGSEAACMMMAYTFGDYILLNRSLFYTGETRAKKEFRFYGEEKFQYGKMLSAFDIAVGKIDDSKRNTSLCEMIKEYAH